MRHKILLEIDPSLVSFRQIMKVQCCTNVPFWRLQHCEAFPFILILLNYLNSLQEEMKRSLSTLASAVEASDPLFSFVCTIRITVSVRIWVWWLWSGLLGREGVTDIVDVLWFEESELSSFSGVLGPGSWPRDRICPMLGARSVVGGKRAAPVSDVRYRD
jgi:hypothetical protein